MIPRLLEMAAEFRTLADAAAGELRADLLFLAEAYEAASANDPEDRWREIVVSLPK